MSLTVNIGDHRTAGAVKELRERVAPPITSPEQREHPDLSVGLIGARPSVTEDHVASVAVLQHLAEHLSCCTLRRCPAPLKLGDTLKATSQERSR